MDSGEGDAGGYPSFLYDVCCSNLRLCFRLLWATHLESDSGRPGAGSSPFSSWWCLKGVLRRREGMVQVDSGLFGLPALLEIGGLLVDI